ncbi:hypothetical protein V6Z11_D11G081200 [Gossypium hirsutum]
MPLYKPKACAIIPAGLATSLGSKVVVLSLAITLNASMFCSTTLTVASLTQLEPIATATSLIAFAVALALASIASALAIARLSRLSPHKSESACVSCVPLLPEDPSTSICL